MRNLILIFLMFLLCREVYSQSELKSIDSTLKNIDANLTELKDELVEEEAEPFSGQSIFEDRKGSSAIFIPYGGTVRMNMADASLKISFVNRISTKKLFYGFDVSGKTSDGVMTLISKGNISPGADANAYFGFNELFEKTNLLDGWITLKIGYEGQAFKLYNPDTLFSKQITQTSFNSLTAAGSLNIKIGGNKILAISAGYNQVNNYSDLDDLELIDRTVFTDSTTNLTRISETKTNVKIGEYKTYTQIPINVDFFWCPGNANRIGLYHYWRGKITDGEFTNGLGTGIYLLKKDRILSSIAGIVFEVNDLSKLSDGFGRNFTVNLIVGYNFDFAKKK